MGCNPAPMSKLTGKGLFCSKDAALATFLSRLGADKSAPSAFAARNFLLDEGITEQRFESYRRSGAVGDHGTLDEWQSRHSKYLTSEVFRPGRPSGPPTSIDPKDPDECPETFRYDAALSSPFASADPSLDLLRVDELRFIARFADPGSIGRLRYLAGQKVRGALSADELAELDDALHAWASWIELRPVFAGFWEDFKDLFGADPSGDKPDWADAIRDRLGLAHLDPAARGKHIDILLFRYPLRNVPKLRAHRDVRPLVPPSVLDGSFSDAFCPAPGGASTGHTIDLSATVPIEGRREVLHPAVMFKANSIFRVGAVTRGVAKDVLPVARAFHLDQVRAAARRSDYALGTDGDLL